MFFYEFGCKVMQTSQVLRSKVQLLLCHSSLHLNLGIAIHLPLCSKPSCASSYKARFPDSDNAEGSEQRYEATVKDPDCRANGLDEAEIPNHYLDFGKPP